MGRIKKYATEEERVIARRQAAARHYSQNKEYKNKMLMLRYYQKKVEELSLLASSSIENQPSYKKINNEWTREDHGVVLESFIDTSSFQLTAFVSSPIYVEGILPTESINITINTPITPLDNIETCSLDSSSFYFNTDTNNIEEGVPTHKLYCISSLDMTETSSLDSSSSFQEAAQENKDNFTVNYLLSSSIGLVNAWSTESITLPDNLTSPIAPTESINISEEFELLQFSYVDKSTDALFNNTIGNIDLTLTSSNLPTDLL
jgi:hypothetical protein